MGLLNFFRRKPPINDTAALAAFIDANAAFLVQKGIYEYSRARAGHYAKVLFGEPSFKAAVEEARWRAYPLGLAMIGEMVEGALPPVDGEERRARLRLLKAVVLSVLARYPVPSAIGEAGWRDMERELALRLDHVGLHPPRRAIDIPETYAEPYFALMPIHEQLRGRDFGTTRNYLRVAMANIHHELNERLATDSLLSDLNADFARP